MTTTILIIVCMTITFFIYIMINKRDKSIKQTEDETKADVSVHISVDNGEYKKLNLQSSLKEREERKKRRELLYAKDARRKCKNQIWAILRYMVTYRALQDSTNFYNYKKNWEEFNKAVGTMKKMQPDDYCFNAAFRFCQMENYYGTCAYTLTNDDIEYVRNWKVNNLNIEDVLQIITESYKTYWDNVLSSYVRPLARTKRLQYLVDDLEEVMALPEIQEHSKIIEQVKNLQKYYLSQLG